MNQIIQIHENSENSNRKNDGHILVVACPLQSHAAVLMKLSRRITNFGTKVTYLSMDSTNMRMTAGATDFESWNQGIRIISIPSGLELESGWKNQEKLLERVHRVIPGYMEGLLKTTKQSSNSCGDRISGVIIDTPLASMLEIPKKMGIRTAIFWCSSPGCLALGFKIPQLIESKVIDNDNGTALKNESIKLLPNMPEMSTTDLVWYFPGDKDKQKSMFHTIKGIIHQMTISDWILCNWFHELDPSAITLAPNILSIGPLLANGQSIGSFCSEDPTCLTWLDKQPKNSVIYVAFGSTSRFSPQQLDELAMGIELTGRPFLWVAWSGLTNGSPPTYSKEFKERVGDRGKIVEWAPQEAVLGHPSTACFVTHCGWNSVLESLSVGVLMLCWPYFGDQMYTESCICDSWKVGMRLKPDENGIVSRHEIEQKVEEILCDGIMRENALKWKRMARESINKGGSSFMNLECVIQQMKSKLS